MPYLLLLTVYIIIIIWFATILLPLLSDVRDVAVISPLSLFLSLFTIYTYYADIMRHRGCLLSSIRRFVFLNLQKKINLYNGTCLMVEHCTWFEKLRINKTALSSLSISSLLSSDLHVISYQFLSPTQQQLPTYSVHLALRVCKQIYKLIYLPLVGTYLRRYIQFILKSPEIKVSPDKLPILV